MSEERISIGDCDIGQPLDQDDLACNNRFGDESFGIILKTPVGQRSSSDPLRIGCQIRRLLLGVTVDVLGMSWSGDFYC